MSWHPQGPRAAPTRTSILALPGHSGERGLHIIIAILFLAATCSAPTDAEGAGSGSLSLDAHDSARLDSGQILFRRMQSRSRNVIGGAVMGVINASADKVWEVLNDFNNFNTFMPRIRASFLVDQLALQEVEGRTSWKRKDLEAVIARYRNEKTASDVFYFYNVLDMPSPIPDRYYLLEMTRERRNRHLRWRLVAGNVRSAEGSWSLEAWGGDEPRTLALYTSYSNPGIVLPHFAVRIAIDKTLPGVIEGVRRRVNESMQ
jgi:hypothetical protein